MARTPRQGIDTTDRKILELHARGLSSVRALEEALAAAGKRLGKSQVAERLARLEAAGQIVRTAAPRGKRPARGSMPAKAKPAKTPAAKRPPRPAPEPVTPPQVDLPPRPSAAIPPDTGDVDVDTGRRRLRDLSARIDVAIDPAFAGDMPFSTLVQAVKLEADLNDRVVRQIIPEPPKAEDDPANADAAAVVTTKLARLVEAAERDARCPHCNKPLLGDAA